MFPSLVCFCVVVCIQVEQYMQHQQQREQLWYKHMTAIVMQPCFFLSAHACMFARIERIRVNRPCVGVTEKKKLRMSRRTGGEDRV